jgi:hypothetical protein
LWQLERTKNRIWHMDLRKATPSDIRVVVEIILYESVVNEQGQGLDDLQNMVELVTHGMFTLYGRVRDSSNAAKLVVESVEDLLAKIRSCEEEGVTMESDTVDTILKAYDKIVKLAAKSTCLELSDEHEQENTTGPVGQGGDTPMSSATPPAVKRMASWEMNDFRHNLSSFRSSDLMMIPTCSPTVDKSGGWAQLKRRSLDDLDRVRREDEGETEDEADEALVRSLTYNY